jgi:hypothetical protein
MNILDPVVKIVDSYIYNYPKYTFYIIIFLHVFYALLFFGIIYVNASYIHEFNLMFQIAICLFLLIRFHPFRKHTLLPYEDKIISYCAYFLLFNLGAVEIFQRFFGISYTLI